MKPRYILPLVMLVLFSLLLSQPALAAENAALSPASSENETPSGELLLEYFDYCFSDGAAEGSISSSGIAPGRRRAAARKKLPDGSQAIYDVLKKGVAEVASGKRTETVFSVPLEDILGQERFTFASLGAGSAADAAEALNEKIIESVDSAAILNAVLTDFPYELYWFDKTDAYAMYPIGNYRMTVSGNVVSFAESAHTIDVYLQVAEEYRPAGASPRRLYDAYGHLITDSSMKPVTMYLTTDAGKTALPKKAAANAKSVQQKYLGSTDLDKLKGYRDYICDQVDYHSTAASDASMPYGNPWQMIWVFDEDPSTNVVCEGYAKAFQYLCDVSAFSKDTVRSTLVTGSISNGLHMWNIMTMEDGLHYLVDLTNCDTADGREDLFLRGASGKITQGSVWGYAVQNARGRTVRYYYDEDTLETFETKELELAGKVYEDRSVHVTGVSILNKGVTTVYTGEKLQLTSAVTPSDAANRDVVWTVSDGTLAQVDKNTGLLTAKKAGRVTVTATSRDSDRTATLALQILQHATSVRFLKEQKAIQGTLQLYIGDKATVISAEALPSDAVSTRCGIRFSGNSSCAATDGDDRGLAILPRSEGQFDIIAVSEENAALSATLHVVVKKRVTAAPDGTEAGKGASAAYAAAAITAGGEEGPTGTSFRMLRARVYKTSENSITIRWKKQSGATRYLIFGSRCGKSRKMKKLATLKAGKWKWTHQKLKKGTAYKYIVMAVSGEGEEQRVLATSKTVHVYTKGGKYGNYKSLSLSKKSIGLKTGKKYRLKVSALKNGRIKRHRKICYESSNPAVATVSAKGRITARGKGGCRIYVYAQDGHYRSVKVKVS